MLHEDFLNGMRMATTGVTIVTTNTPRGWVGATGTPSLVGALVAFECSLVREVRCGSHHVIIGAVCDVEQGDGRPLLYCDRTYGRVTIESLQPAV